MFVDFFLFSFWIHCRNYWIAYTRMDDIINVCTFKHFIEFSITMFILFGMCIFISLLLLLLLFVYLFSISSYWLFIVFCFIEKFFTFFDEWWIYLLLCDIFMLCHGFIDFCILYVYIECFWLLKICITNVTQIHMSKELYYIVLKDIRALNRFLRIFLQTLMNCL